MACMTSLVVRRTDVSDLGFGACPVRLDVPLLDDYLIFLAGRCRPNTVLATAYDLKVFFTVVGKAPQDVVPADVLAFMTAQRIGQPGSGRLQAVPSADVDAAMSARTVRRRLSSVSGLFAFLQVRGRRRGPARCRRC
jgi:integrase/recombinase XerD